MPPAAFQRKRACEIEHVKRVAFVDGARPSFAIALFYFANISLWRGRHGAWGFARFSRNDLAKPKQTSLMANGLSSRKPLAPRLSSRKGEALSGIATD